MSKRAIILAGGKGTRLRPYTAVFPKPLMPLGDYPILEIILMQLIESGFDRVTMALNHQASIIQSYFGDGSHWGIKIDYSIEKKPLSTMGPLKMIDDLPDDFLIMNGDVLSDLNYGLLYDKHVEQKNLFTISSYSADSYIDYGVLETEQCSLKNFIEKPHYNYEVSMGVYIANKEILEYIPDNQPFGFDQLMLLLIQKNRTVKVYNYDGIWLDIGRPDDYEKAIDMFENEKERFLCEKK